MKRKECLAKLEQDIMWRKDAMVRSLENDLKYVQKYLEELKKSDSVGDVLNNARAVNSYAESLSRSAANEFGSMNEVRLGLYWLQGIED